MRGLLTQLGIAALPTEGISPGTEIQEALQKSLAQATIIIVLIGATTRFSRWVDTEIQLATQPTKSAPGAGLIGVVLPTHDDFSKPYYEPDLVPLRLHDRVQAEYAILRKWTDDPAEIVRWIQEADRRRWHYDSLPSIRAMMQLRQFPWSVEEARPRLFTPASQTS